MFKWFWTIFSLGAPVWGIFTRNWNLYIKNSIEIISKFIEFDLWPENEI